MVGVDQKDSNSILKGTSPRSLPSAWPDNMLCAYTETHWQTTESFLAFVTILDNKLQGQSSAPDPWVFLIDVGPVHIAYAFRSALPKHIHLCYINPSSTSVAQPADVGAGHCMRQLLCDHSAVRKSTSTAGGTSWPPGAGQGQPTHGGGHTFPQRQTWTTS